MSVTLLATTLSLGQFGLANRFFILDLEMKSVSQKLAEACVNIARIEVYNNPAYSVTSPITLPVGADSCTLFTITRSSTRSTVEAKGVKGNAITNLQVVIDNMNGNFISWAEIPTL